MFFLLLLMGILAFKECNKDEYLIEEKKELHEGGQGTAYVVKDVGGKSFVYKEYDDEDGFKVESKILSAFEHPNIIKIHCVFSKEYAVLLPYYSEGDVHKLSYGTSNDLIKKWAYQLILATHAVHKHGYVHTDIKPRNLLRDGEKLYLIDFGLALPLNRIVDHQGTESTMAPEMHIRGSGILDKSLDWWSVGATIWMMEANSKQEYNRKDRRNIYPYHVTVSMSKYADVIKHPFPDYFDDDLVELIMILMQDDPKLRNFDKIDKLISLPYFKGIRV